MYFGDVKAGQVFNYSVNPIPGGGTNADVQWWEGVVNPLLPLIHGATQVDWNAVAQRIASSFNSTSYGRASVVNVAPDGTGMTFSVTSSMDRGSMDDLRGNLDSIVSSQPEISGIAGSMIRLTNPALNPNSSQPLNISPMMWAVMGIGLWLLLRR